MSLRETLIWAWTYYGGRDPWFVLTILVEPIGSVVLLLLWLRRRPRGPMNPLLRAVGAALASWVIPFGLGAAAFLAGPGLNARGEVDDAPYRAGAGLLFLTPIFLTVLTAYFLTLTAILGKLKRLTLSTLLGVAAVMGAAVGSSFYNQGLAVGGRSDAIRSFLTFSLGTFICLGSGCAMSWWLGRDKPR